MNKKNNIFRGLISIKFLLTIKYTKVLRNLKSLLFSLTQIRVIVYSSFRFVRGLFVIYGIFSSLIRRKHEEKLLFTVLGNSKHCSQKNSKM